MELREFRRELPSTQTEAIHRARVGAPDGTRVVAGRQSAGRGRGDHRWASPEGNLYLSVVFRAPTDHRAILPLAIGAALRAAMDERYRVRSVLKWPNDLLVLGTERPRKLAGILVDAVPSPMLGVAAVVGVGVNVAARPETYPPELRARTVSLSELMPAPPTLPEVEEVVVAAARSAVHALTSDVGAASVLSECRAALYGVGRQATVDSTLTGTVRTIGEEGELWLDTPAGAVAVRAGDLVVEES